MASEQTHDPTRRTAPDASGDDTFEATAFDDLTRTAADVLEAPMAFICLTGAAGGQLKARVGLGNVDSAVDSALASWAVRHAARVLLVKDATKDARLQDAPFVNGAPHVRFFASAPLTVSSADVIGALCVMDSLPRQVTAEKLERLQFLADQIVGTLKDRRAAEPGGQP